MNERDFDSTARAWLEDGPTRMSDDALLSALEEIHTTRQRRAWWPARRATPVNMFARVAIAAVLVAGVGLAAFNVISRDSGGSGVGGPPAASPTPNATPTAIPSPTARPSPSASELPTVTLPELTQTFVSSFNGFSIGYEKGVEVDPATEIWVPLAEGNDGYDFVPFGTGGLRAASVEAPSGVTIDEAFVDDWVLGIQPGGCALPGSTLPQMTIDGQQARISTSCPNEITGTIVIGRRVYEFTLFGEASNLRDVFDAYAATIDLTPETAAKPSSSPST
jgi:hypothetical protein